MKVSPMDPAEFEKKMAVYHESLKYCTQCLGLLMNNEKSYTPTICRACSEKNKKVIRMNKINAAREGLTLEERVNKIEEWMFDHCSNHPQREFGMR